MTTTLTPELIAQLRSLSADDKDAVIDLLLPDDPPAPPVPEAERAGRREMIARRIGEYQRGEVKAFTVEETLAAMDATIREIEDARP